MTRPKCRQCGAPYTRKRPTQRVCGDIGCALGEGRTLQAKADKEAHRQRKKALRGVSWWKKAAQKEFNAYIRLRDEASGLPCVSCGRYHNGQWHASHYRPTVHSALRFNEINVWRACAPCNSHKSGNLIPYREELVRRIGEDLVLWLEKDHPKVTPWTIEELQGIRDYYKNARRELLATPGEAEPF